MVEIEKAARRATGLAKQMLACSGRGKFVVRPIQLNEFVSEMIHMLEVIISKKAVLKFNYADNLPVFKGDETLIRQIIMNLITNASEPIGDRSGVIAISTGAMVCNRDYLSAANLPTTAGLPDPLPEGVYVFFKVADTGCGMTVEVQQKLFDPLFTTKFTGRGLGMAAVQGIVRGQKGAIKVYSEIGKGSTFKVLFPVAEEAWQVEILGDHPDTTSQWSGDGAILVADDEEAVCAVSKFMRERVGFDVMTAPDGRAALDLFKANVGKVACVLLDLTMPNMNGDEVFREMRLLQPDIKVNISSGYNKHDATQHFTGKGLAGFIQKPYFSTALISKLREVLQNPIGN